MIDESFPTRAPEGSTVSKKIRTSRVLRVASMTGAAGGVAVRMATSKAIDKAGGAGSAESRKAAASRQQLAAARQLVAILGGMRGAAMKGGQSLSTIDMGMVPEEIRPEFQAILAKLQDSAKPAPFKQVRKIIESDLEQPLDELFASIDQEPIAAASIGQPFSESLLPRNACQKARFSATVSSCFMALR